MKQAAASCLFLAFFTWSVFSQTVRICGIVTDQKNGYPLTHTVVRLGQTTYDNGYGQSPYITTTDNYGSYKLGSACGCVGVGCVQNIIPKSVLTPENAFSQPIYVGGKVLFSLPAGDALVRMSIYDLSGRLVRDVMNKRLCKGNYSASIDTRAISSRFYLLRVTINGVASVMRLQPASRLSGEAVVQSSPEFQTRLEKLAAVVDTLYATEPGYTIGITPITSLTGGHEFTLTKNNTYTGDSVAFWGDTSTYPKTNGIQYVILNRTNGAFPDSQIFWSIYQPGNGVKTSIATQSTVQVPGLGGRFYVWVAPNDSGNRYFDFIEGNSTGTTWMGNTTRVDGWRLPIAFWLHTSTGHDITLGDSYEMFFQSRQAIFDEFKNEVPKEFTGLATQDFAHIWAPNTSPVNYFGTGGPYETYFDKYQDSVIAHNPGAPTKTTTWNIFANAGPLAASPDYSGAYNRHVGTLPQGANFVNWRTNDTSYYYQAAPCNYFSRWCHRRSLRNLCYGFPYDDAGNHAAYTQKDNVQWVAIAVGW